MERLYSKSIFSLAPFLYHTTLTPFDSTTSTTQLPPAQQLRTEDDVADEAHDAPHPSTQSPIINKLRCNACSVSFEDVKQQHAHYKLPWHAYVILFTLVPLSFPSYPPKITSNITFTISHPSHHFLLASVHITHSHSTPGNSASPFSHSSNTPNAV